MSDEHNGGLFDDASLFELADSIPYSTKVQKALETLREYEKLALQFDPDGYYLCFSGGKDSVVIKKLAEMANIKFKSWHNFTTIDPPELIRFIKKHHPDVTFSKPEKPLLSMAADTKGLPTRRIRWCCELYKERGGEGKVKILGVRAEESDRRKHNWKILTPWRKKEGWCVCPILYWRDSDVWRFVKENNVPYCSLYDEGLDRLGCIGCPMGGKKRMIQFSRWPAFERAWKRAAFKHWEKYHGKINPRTGNLYSVNRFDTPEHFWKWWLSDKSVEGEGCTMGLF